MPVAPAIGAVLVHPGHFEPNPEVYFEDEPFVAQGWPALGAEVVTVGVGQLDYTSEYGEQLVNSALHVLGTSKFATHLWRAVLAHDLAESFGYDVRGAIGHSMGGMLALMEGIADARLHVAQGDAHFGDLCQEGPALTDATPGLHSAGIRGHSWSTELQDTVPVWQETQYGESDPIAFLEEIRGLAAAPESIEEREPVFSTELTSFVQVEAADIDTPADIADPWDPRNGVTARLRAVRFALGRLAIPGDRSADELLGAAFFPRYETEMEVGCEADEGRAWSPQGWGSLDFTIVRPAGPPTAIVAVVPSWSRLAPTDALAVAEHIAARDGALVLVVPELLPGKLDGLSGVVITSGVQSMGGSVMGTAAHQLLSVLDWARAVVPDGAGLPTVIVTEGRSEAFVGAAAAWFDPSVRAIVWEERSARGLIEANFGDAVLLEGLRWFFPWDMPPIGFGRVQAGDPDALWCPASFDWQPGLGQVDLQDFYGEVGDQLRFAPGLELSDVSGVLREVAAALAGS